MLQEIMASIEEPKKKVLVAATIVELTAIETDIVTEEEISMVKDSIAVDALAATAGALENLSGEALATVETGGLSDQGLMVLMAGISSTLSITGMAPVEMPSGEQFGEEGARVEMTTLAGEGLMDKAKSVWKQIRAFLERIGKSIKAFWVKQTSMIARYEAKNAAALEKYKDFTGTTDVKEVKYSGVAAIMTGGKMAMASDVMSDAKAVSAAAKIFTDMAKKIEGIEGTEPGAIDSSIEDAVSKLGKEMPAAEGKDYQMTEGYEKIIKGEMLLGDDMLVIGIAKADSDKGTRGKFVTGKADKKAKEAMGLLSIEHAKGMFVASGNALDAAKEAKEAGDKVQEAMTKVLKAVDEAVKGDDDAKAKAAQKTAKKVKDLQSLSSDAAMGLYKHAAKVAAVCHNVGLTALKKYKTEKKTEDK